MAALTAGLRARQFPPAYFAAAKLRRRNAIGFGITWRGKVWPGAAWRGEVGHGAARQGIPFKMRTQ